MKQTFNLVFDHCINDGEFDELPAYRGIYLFKVTTKGMKPNSFKSRVVYIGKADEKGGLRGRITPQHEHLEDARKLVKKAKETDPSAFLIIAYTNENPDLENYNWLPRAEAALINGRKPEINCASTVSFGYDETELKISGDWSGGLERDYDVK